MDSTRTAERDRIDPDLRLDAVATSPRQLPCARCGRTLAGHVGEPPDCDGFVRPGLPSGFVYVDQLDRGAFFRFVSRTRQDARVAARAPFDLDPATGLFQLESHEAGGPDVVHLVERNTVVGIAPHVPA